MEFFRRKIPPIEVGNLFVKVGDPPSKVWEVIKLWSTVDGIPHARIRSHAQQSESRLVAINVLSDRKHYRQPKPS
jgi:hypothetical protein